MVASFYFITLFTWHGVVYINAYNMCIAIVNYIGAYVGVIVAQAFNLPLYSSIIEYESYLALWLWLSTLPSPPSTKPFSLPLVY